MTPDPESQPTPDTERQSLRGTMTAVLLMAAFFVVTWLGVYALLLDRR